MPPKQHSTYNWHLALLWVSVMHALTRSSITVNNLIWLVPRSSVSLLLGFGAMLSVSLVFHGLTARSLHDNMLGCQSPSGEWS